MWHLSAVGLTLIRYSNPGYSGFQSGYSGSAQPAGSGLKSGHSGNQTKLNLNLFDDAHDDMIYTQFSLGLLHLPWGWS